MHAIIPFVMRTVEILFFLGLAGSAIVVLISSLQDTKELFREE